LWTPSRQHALRQIDAQAAVPRIAPDRLDQQVRGAGAEVEHAQRRLELEEVHGRRRQRTSVPAESSRFSRS
jgi:hypothetical protein